MQMLYRSRARRLKKRATIKRADVKVIQIKGPQREEKGDDRADTEAIQPEAPQREEMGNNIKE